MFRHATLLLLVATLLGWLGGVGTTIAAVPEYVEGEVIVTFKPTENLTSARNALSRRAMQLTERFGALSVHRGRHTGLVRERSKSTAELIAQLRADPTVETVEPNYIRHIKAVPNDSRFNEEWALNNTGQMVDGVTGTASADIKFLAAQALSRITASGEIVVGVIDTGVDITHPDLAPNIWTNPLETAGNSADDDGNTYPDDLHGWDFAGGSADPFDSGDHGTHVAGTIAALGNNSAGVVGVCDRVKILPLKVSDDGDSIDTAAEIKALQYATALKKRGVNIVALNASFGGGGNSTAERAALQAAGEAGIIVCVAAGNETANNDTTPSYPASYRLANMIVVAATDQNDNLASYSNFGAASVDLAAPGSNILSTAPATYSVQVGTSTFAADRFTFARSADGLSGNIVDCGTGNTRAEFPAAVAGNIALIKRGTQNFSVKVQYAMQAGATAALIYNNVSGSFGGTLQTAGNWIPTFALTQSAGNAIKATLPKSGTITLVPGYQFMDGTSMATPHVVGAVALAALNFPNDTLSERRARVLNSAEAKPKLATKVATGGRLNLLRLLDANSDGIADWQPAITTNTLPTALLGKPYGQSLAASGGAPPFRWALLSGSLPVGLTLSNAGVISGTANQEATTSFTVQATDAEDVVVTKTLSLTVGYAPLLFSQSALPSGIIAANYSTTLHATGGDGAYTWSLVSGSLPEGLALSPAGVLTGTPQAVGSYTLGLQVVDGRGLSTTANVTLTVNYPPVTITTTSLGGSITGTSYQETVSAVGGTGLYTFTRSAGNLPPGIVLSASGTLSGTPTTPGAFNFTVKVTDSAGSISTRNYSVIIVGTSVVPTDLTITTEPMLTGAVRAPLSVEFLATGGSGSGYVWVKTAGKLPKGLTLAVDGRLTGVPTVSGTYAFALTVKDSAGHVVTKPFTAIIAPLPEGTVGTFTGPIQRVPGVNSNLGGYFLVTTTASGTFSGKVVQGATSRSIKGNLSAALDGMPTLQASVNGGTLGTLQLSLVLQGTSQTATGSLTASGTNASAEVEGWRCPWSAARPATNRTGYYTAALELAAAEEIGDPLIPQGTGYLTLRISKTGAVTVGGRNADHTTQSFSTRLGAQGEVLLYRSLYSGGGSTLGRLVVAEDVSTPANNALQGELTWLKPASVGRSYAAGFGPLPLAIVGAYLAPSPSGPALGLPLTGASAELLFSEGGLENATLSPNITFAYTAAFKATPPTLGSATNPARTTLTLNRASGLLTGSFTLPDTTPARVAPFYGITLRLPDHTTKAAGYFLLPQLPATGSAGTNTPIRSGQVVISQ